MVGSYAERSTASDYRPLIVGLAVSETICTH